MSETEEPAECEACGYPAKDLKSYPGRPLAEPDTRHMFCDICATTFISNMTVYARIYTDAERNIAGAVGYIGNLLLNEIRKTR